MNVPGSMAACRPHAGHHTPSRRAASLILLVLTLGLCLLATGCIDLTPRLPHMGGSGESTSSGGGGTGKPYTVKGKTYRPYTTANGFTEVGVASWYGPGFHGKTTANGERYNQNALTAAHKLLPFNTDILVTNLDNGKTVTVRINDRGPFVNNRIIDLSRRAAERIGMIGPGTARVRLQAVNGDRQPVLTPNGDMEGRFYIQIGAFSLPVNARKLMQVVKGMGLGGRILRNANSGLQFVQVGPYRSLDQAESVLQGLRHLYPGLFVVAD